MKKKTYDQLLDEALGQYPQYELPKNFARNVTLRLYKAVPFRFGLIDFVLMIIVITFIIFTVIGLYFVSRFIDPLWPEQFKILWENNVALYPFLPYLVEGILVGFIIFILGLISVLLNSFRDQIYQFTETKNA